MTTPPPSCKCFLPSNLEVWNEGRWKLAAPSCKLAGGRSWFLGAAVWWVSSKQRAPSM